MRKKWGDDALNLIITVLSAVAMGFVVYLHTPTLPTHWMLDLAVPFFFFASGWWLAKGVEGEGKTSAGRWWRKEIGKRLKSLLVPFYLWNLIWFPILFTCNWLGWRYCGAQRVVDASVPCVVRCLGLSVWQWPALVPTWFLRALFVGIVAVSATWVGLLKVMDRKGGRREGLRKLGFVMVAGMFWIVNLTHEYWLPDTLFWKGFITFGVPLFGMALIATGGALRVVFYTAEQTKPRDVPFFVSCIRRQMMPVYLLHAPVIISCGWGAKALKCFEIMATIEGDVVMWFVGVGGAMIAGTLMRRWCSRAAKVLFGGR